ncbi:MAG: polysaccharide deacetylase family protein [Pseudomonadota bacterium]|nr:polysaccharide deacetylase family protein [Pseudomonadota bacterium]
MKKHFFTFCFLSLGAPLLLAEGKVPFPAAREIALTFDDCPRKTGTLMTGMERAKKLINTLKDAEVRQVGFFCNSPTRAPDGMERLMYFAFEGHLIANHSASHLDLNKTSIEEFTKNIEQADHELSSLPNFRKWFRFPYLREGKTPADVNTVRMFLTKMKYKNGYVTVDNNDWYIDDLLGLAIADGKKFDQLKLCTVYAKIMSDEAEFFDNMSVKALGRSVKHVMLLHETDLNAICIGNLIAELRLNRWVIISPDIAYTDPIAKREPIDTVSLNQGRVFALAKEKGYQGPYWSKWIDEEEVRAEFERAGVWQR